MRKYRIKKAIYYNEYGMEVSSYFYLQYQKDYLFFKMWKDVKHEICCMSGCYSVITKFKTHEEASEHAHKGNIPKQKWVYKLIAYL